MDSHNSLRVIEDDHSIGRKIFFTLSRPDVAQPSPVPKDDLRGGCRSRKRKLAQYPLFTGKEFLRQSTDARNTRTNLFVHGSDNPCRPTRLQALEFVHLKGAPFVVEQD